MGYFVIEAPDCAGKSTLVKNLSNALPDALVTGHPGSTKVGSILRTLIKNPLSFGDGVKLSSKSAQILMSVDHIEYIEQLLKPTLASGRTVISDRINWISGIMYGLGEGLSDDHITQILSLYDSPTPTKMFVLQLPWDVIEKRLMSRDKLVPDRFEDNGSSYQQRVHQLYNDILSPRISSLYSRFMSTDDIIMVDANVSPEELTNKILDLIGEHSG